MWALRVPLPSLHCQSPSWQPCRPPLSTLFLASPEIKKVVNWKGLTPKHYLFCFSLHWLVVSRPLQGRLREVWIRKKDLTHELSMKYFSTLFFFFPASAALTATFDFLMALGMFPLKTVTACVREKQLRSSGLETTLKKKYIIDTRMLFCTNPLEKGQEGAHQNRNPT